MGIEEFVLDRAKKQGKVEGKAEDVKNLITKMGLADAQISEVLELQISFVEKIRQELNK